ncbi:E2F-associated phosphoprotein [Pelomyxa schiedti]|nr:E2F-associated phosphoprotein [Pelomyxa schiedti]
MGCCGDGVETDAHLSCPCCFTLLCVDCQQHEVYHTQYRAMFVRNCKVDRTQTLTYADNSEPTKTTTAARSTATTVDDGASGDTYHPVLCANCGLEVGVFDKDELYHFFNVIPS